MNLEAMQRIILDFQTSELPTLTERELEITPIDGMSFTIVGCRRAGKTFRTYQYLSERYRGGVSRENICRIQFNDHRLQALPAAELDVIDRAYFSLFPEKRGREDVFFIFDEIHRIDGWENYVLYLLDTARNRVLITGSTSKLLTGDIASALRGKNFSRELLPFSFREFARHYGVPADPITSDGSARLVKLLQQYIRQGGFPGLLNLDPSLHHDLLESYWDTMILRDIIEAHPEDNINIVSFTRFLHALLARLSCPVTINKISVNLRQDGVKFSAETLYKYMHYLKEAYLLYTVEFFSCSEKVRGQNYRKVYAVDWALANAAVPAEGVHPTRQFENLVYIELRRRGYELSYYRTRQGHEVDFVALNTQKHTGNIELYQVCYALDDPEVRQRELRAIAKAATYLQSSRCCIITLNDEEILDHDGTRIEVVPAWKWLLL
ncbi:MAG: hypothetical protein A3K19_18165 [Lentisphaerae bacterium RIFOXYB12_FULL_65_16]|nr:MAG: hypothetical protein A3K18_12515 [Lentisphaerae bacterium RIFOXYA12_64_32]OGV87101.1 MAG: hypothetical protein A3K19_18165 [Lentisphaerae bacterium RIFOXYB12_FULL_65_16]